MKNKKILAVTLIVTGVVCLVFGLFVLWIVSSKTENTQTVKLCLYPNTSTEQVEKMLRDKGVIDSGFAYSLFVKVFCESGKMRSGYYEIAPKIKQAELAKMLSRGLQTPVKLVIGKVRTYDDFAEKVSSQLMISKEDLLLSIENLEYDLFENVIPNTYQVYWNTTSDKLLRRLKAESDHWWKARAASVEKTGLNRHEIVVLASIVEEETNKNEEKPTIAGVYINRLHRDMLLQADPTVRYAVGDFTIKRIMYKHLQTDSPYNTYMYKGLPPSAICLPEQSSLLSVLNYQKHDYIFFCAKEDFSGYHNFASTPDQHYANANKYQAALNKMGIK